MSAKITVAAALALVVWAWPAGPATAADWTNQAVGSTVGGNQVAQGATSLVDEEVTGGRWHQGGLDFDVTPGRIYFTRSDPVDISHVRIWNWSDHTTGTMDWTLQQLTGADPNNDADWTAIPGTSVSFANYPAFYDVAFSAVNTKGLRWYITKDNNPAGVGNIRYSEVEFYSVDQDALDLTPLTTEIKHSNGTDLKPVVADDDTFTRYDGPFGAQTVRMLWGEAITPTHLRIYDEDRAQGMQAFTVQYLASGGDPDNEADWLETGIAETDNHRPVLNYDLSIPATLGLRLNITDPSTNSGHEILRLRELEVFGTVGDSEIPEPATALLVGAGLLGLLRRRRRA